MTEHKRNNIRVKGIFLVPNLLTVSALFSGFYAIVAANHQDFVSAAVAIFVAMLFDGLDGRVARFTQTQSKFGAELDSLSDMVCFGVTPALVLYSWSLSSLGKLGWLTAFFFTVCAALRLARFNSQAQHEDKQFFQGLSTTAAAGFIAGLIWSLSHAGINGQAIAFWVMPATIVVSLLSVSRMRYYSFKDYNPWGRVSFFGIILLVSILVLVSLDPSDVLFSIFALYAFSGPVTTVLTRRKKLKIRRRRKV